MEKKTESFEKDENGGEKNTKIDSSQSHAFVNRIKQEHLRSTRSSPHNNLELHHTRSFREICHLHPSHTEISFMNNICPKLKAIADLQHEVCRPESVLEMVDLASSESDDDSDEDIMTTQQKGDEAMKIFLESNVSIPLDGAMTSSSLSQDTLDSDVASESELFVGNWEREGRDSVASNSSNIGKRFLTPSGQLLFREHQVDSMLDTKRLKLTPSSSERPMSPLALQRSDENVKCRNGGSESGSSGNEGGRNRRRYRMVSDSDSEGQEDVFVLNKENVFVSREDPGGKKMKTRNCDCDLRLQDLRQVVHKYEVQCEELINRSKQQCDEIKTLRKDNVNMHKEHNRLQVVIRDQNEAALNGNMAGVLGKRDEKNEELRLQIRELEKNLQEKTSEITQLQSAVGSHVDKGRKYLKIIKEINNESRAFMKALAKELGVEEAFEVDNEEKPEAVIALLKTRRESLPEDFKNFYKNVSQAMDGDAISEIQDRMKQEFYQISAGYKDTISKIQKTEKGMGRILKRSASLETLLKQTKEKYMAEELTSEQFKKSDVEVKLRELRRKNERLMQEDKLLREDCSKWKARCEEIATQNKKSDQMKVGVKLREEKPLASKWCEKLKKYLKQRRRSYSDTELGTLKDHCARFGPNSIEGASDTWNLRELRGTSPTKGARNMGKLKGLGLGDDLENRLKQLSEQENVVALDSSKTETSFKTETISSKGATSTEKIKGLEETRSSTGASNTQNIRQYADRLKQVAKADHNARLGNSEAKTSSTKEASNTGNLKGLGDLEERLKELSKLTENLSEKIEKTNEHLEDKTASSKSKQEDSMKPDRTLSAFYGGQLFSVIKGIYNDHLSTQQDNIHSREQECRYLKEQLGVKESNEEIMQCYIESLKRAIVICQDDLRDCKGKNQSLKKELRQLKDRVLVTNAEREMSLFYCKKNGVANGGKHEDWLEVGRPAQGNKGNACGNIEETGCFRKQIKHAGM